jgi:hypothetical protein
VLNAQDVTRPMLERYQRVLFHHRKQDGTPLSFAGQHVRLTTIQGFFKWLCRKYYITANPAADLELPKVESASSGVSRSEQRRYFVEPARFTTLKRGGANHNFQVESIVYNGGHRFPTGAPGKEELLPYKMITFNQK